MDDKLEKEEFLDWLVELGIDRSAAKESLDDIDDRLQVARDLRAAGVIDPHADAWDEAAAELLVQRDQFSNRTLDLLDELEAEIRKEADQ